MNTKILVLGSTGMLGHMVLKVLSREKKFTVSGTCISNSTDLFYFDVEEGLEKLDLIFSENKGYDYFINCIGITADKIDPSNSRSITKAIKVNALFPHELAEFVREKNAKLIHISTDGVFLGCAELYDEDAPCDCFDVYGKTKSLGEVVNSNVLNIRCSIIGPSPYERGGLFEWFQSQPEGSVISGYTNHVWTGITTFQFAKLCQRIIEGNQFDCLRKESAIFHFVPNQQVSKYKLLTILKSALNKKITINPVEHSKGTVKRILVSKYSGLKRLYGHDIPMEKAIRQLIEFAG
jgi:dTDP-4-dehydrorhamnose reductase